MRKEQGKSAEPKGVYRVKNWPAYNAVLIARGDVTMWIDESALTQDTEIALGKRGRPCIYSDAVIQMLLEIKQVFRLPLRALQGFACSLRKLAFADLPVPNYAALRVAVLAHLPLPLAEELQARAVDDQVQRPVATLGWQYRVQILCATTQRRIALRAPQLPRGRPYRLNPKSRGYLCLQIRFMQQRPE